MAIDPRISLAVTTPDIGGIFNSALSNLQNFQALQERQALAPLQHQQTQFKTDLLQQQSQQALSPEAQLGAQQQQSQQIATSYATALRPLLNNPPALLAELQKQRVQFQSAGVDISGIDEDIAQIQTPEGLKLLSQEVSDTLTPTGGVGIQATQFIPGKGFATINKRGEAGLVSIADVGETAEEKRTADIEKSAQIERTKSKLQGLSAAKRLAVTKSGVAFDKLANIDVAITNFDDAIRAIDEGAQTGTIISMLPSFRKSSIELDNIQKALGLDVVSNTTFGALSESELAFALSKALPKNLNPEDLKTWLQSKKAVQQKLRDHISDAAQFLGTGENTIPDWIELQKARSVIQQPQVTDSAAGEFTGFKVVR